MEPINTWIDSRPALGTQHTYTIFKDFDVTNPGVAFSTVYTALSFKAVEL